MNERISRSSFSVEDDSRRTEKSAGPSHLLKPSVVDPEPGRRRPAMWAVDLCLFHLRVTVPST